MRKYYTFIIGLVTIAAVICLFIFYNFKTTTHPNAVNASSTASQAPQQKTAGTVSQAAAQSSSNTDDSNKARFDVLKKMLSAPIEFYGQVVDQNNNGVADAKISFSSVIGISGFRSNASSEYSASSDKDGFFSIKGISGAVLSVYVQKDGYCDYKDKSNAAFGYGLGPDSSRKIPPTEDHPAIFVLWKKGKVVPLVESRFHPSIKADGTPLEMDLIKGSLVPVGTGNLRVELWSEEVSQATVAQNGHYDWRCKISIPSGGLAERTDLYKTSAPQEGYNESVSFNFSKEDADWKDNVHRNCFVHLANGSYGLVNYKIVPDGGNGPFIQINSRVNPTPGQQNLESNSSAPFGGD
jgi:hypothetical protein